jgi:hypothetical protein
MTFAEPNISEADSALHEMALYVYRYARRWAVGQSPDPEDAVIYDACISVLDTRFAPRTIGSSKTPSAANDRYIRYGAETITNPFTIPITVADAVVTLHRYARRYTNGRGSFTAALVNTTAQDLLDAGISLDETRRLDGTIWAADGADGEHDGLTPEQRAEALGILPHQQPAS